MATQRKTRAKAAVTNTARPGSMPRSFLIALLVTITALGIATLTSIRWTENQVLTTDNWLAYVSPLPENPEVNRALSSFVVGKIFTNQEVNARVAEALPPRAGFLADPLTEQLRSITARATEQVLGSDGFQSVWVTANRVAHERVLARARGEQTLSEQANERFQLNLSEARPAVQKVLGRTAEVLPARSEPIEVSADLQARGQRLGQYIRTVDFLNKVLPFLLVATGIGALALARDRRRTLLIGSAAVFVLALLQLIGVKALRPVIFNKIQNLEYRPAVGILYDTLLASFNSLVYGVLIAAGLVWLAMFLAGPAEVGNRLRRFVRMNELQRTSVYDAWRNLRLWIADQKYYLWAVVGIAVLFYLAFVTAIDWQVMSKTILVALAGVGLLQVLATPPYLIQKGR